MKNFLQTGDNIALLESLLTHPDHSAGDTFTNLVAPSEGVATPVNLVESGDPVVAGNLVGVANQDALRNTDLITVSTRGVFSLAVLAKHAGGVNDAVAVGDAIFIDGATAVLSKDATKTPFGIALGTVGAGATGTIPVKIVAAGVVAAVTQLGGPTDTVTEADANGAIAIASGTVDLGGAGARDMTLATPATPGDDGKRIFIVGETAAAHTVTTAANKIKNSNASGDTLTFANVGDSVELEAIDGLWYVRSINGPVLTEV